MGSRIPPNVSSVSENSHQNIDEVSCSAEFTEKKTHVVDESGDGQFEKPLLNFTNGQTDQQGSVSTPVSDQSSSADKLIAPDRRVNGTIFGTVIGHTYTDNKHTDLDAWLPEALNQTAAKRKVLMDLEQKAAKFITEDTSQQYILLKSSDTYQRLAIYRVTAYFGLECRPKDGDLIAWRTPYTRIPEDDIRFEGMLRELREEREGIDPRLVDQGGDMRSMPVCTHIRDPSVFYSRQSYPQMPSQTMRFRNPNVQNRFGPSQPSFPYGLAPSHPLSARVPPPVRRYYSGGPRFRGSLPPGGHFMNNHHPRWTAPEMMPPSVTYDGIGNTGSNRSRSVPNVVSGVLDSANVHKSASGMSAKNCDNQFSSVSGEVSDRSTNSGSKAETFVEDNSAVGLDTDNDVMQTDNILSNAQTTAGSLTQYNKAVPRSNTAFAQPNNTSVNQDLNTCSQSVDGETGYTIAQIMSSMAIETTGKDQDSGTEGIDKLVTSGALMLSNTGNNGNQYHLQGVVVGSSSSGNDHLSVIQTASQTSNSPLRTGAPPYPPPISVQRPSTLNVYNSHNYSGQPMTPGQPTMLMVADSQGYLQASPQVGHTHPVAAAPVNGNGMDQSSAMPVLPQTQSILYLAPQQISHQPHHQTPSFIYLNPVQPNPVISSGGQSSEYVVAQYRDMPPPPAGPPPPLSVPYSSYLQVQQVAASVPPPTPGGLTYYTAPGEVMYTGAAASQQSQPVSSHEYVQYAGGSAMPLTGYTFSPYIPQQIQSPSAAGFVNYIPTAAAYPGTYAASTPLVFQPVAGYNVPPPPTDVTRLPSEVHRPVQWVPVAGGKGSGFMSTVHIAPSTPTRPVNVADVQLVGQPINVHPYVSVAQFSANQRMDGATTVMANTNPPIYRMPPPAQTTYHKSASYGIRPSGGTFRSAGPTTISMPARPSNMQYQ